MIYLVYILLFFSGLGFKSFYGFALPLYYLLLVIISTNIVLVIAVNKRLDWLSSYLKYSIWLVFPLFFLPFAENFTKHVYTLIIIALSILVAVFINKRNYTNIGESRNFDNFIKIWAIVNLVLFFLYLFGINFGAGVDFSGVADNRNFLATTTCLLLAIKLFFVKNEKYSDWISIFSLVIIIIATASSKGLVGLSIIFFIYLTFHIGILKIKINYLLYGIFAVSLMTFMIFYFDSIFIESAARLLAKFGVFGLFDVDPRLEELAVLSQQERENLLQQSLELISHNYLYGLGFGGSELYLEANNKMVYSHINYIELILTSGILVVPIYYFHHYFIILNSALFVLHSKRVELISVCTILLLLLLFDTAMVSYTNLIFWVVLISVSEYAYCVFRGELSEE